VIWRLALTIGLFAGLAPAIAHAQTNIDQGKTPAQIFANDCAACHKAVRGLANGKNSATLASFLREHYTASREQAAALAAYVLGGGGGDGGARGQKPLAERGKPEESKPAKPLRPGKPEEGTPATAKLQRPGDDDSKPVDDATPTDEPSPTGPARGRASRHDKRQPTATAARGRHKEGETPPPATPMSAPPATASAGEPASEKPSAAADPAHSAATPASAQSGEGAAVPRDDIPD